MSQEERPADAFETVGSRADDCHMGIGLRECHWVVTFPFKSRLEAMACSCGGRASVCRASMSASPRGCSTGAMGVH